jgi:hypothetical protein
MTKVLFLAANLSDAPVLKLEQEISAIDRKMVGSEFRDLFDIKQQFDVRITDLHGFLLRHKPDIVHFSGHGTKSSGIVLQTESNTSHPVSTEGLSQLFSILKKNIRCIVLNACYTAKQAEAIAEHIECVVGMSQAIKDTAAISFAAAFYQALGFGESVQTAFDLGCNQIILDTPIERLSEHDTPKLLAPNGNPETIFFAGFDKFIRNLVEGNDHKRLKAAQELTTTPQKHLTKTLIERSKADPNPTVRQWINRALGKLGSVEAIAALRRNRIEDPDPFGALGAEDALKELGIEVDAD